MHDITSTDFEEADAIQLEERGKLLARFSRLEHTVFHNNQVNSAQLAEYWDLVCEKLPANAPARQLAVILHDTDTQPLKVYWSYTIPLAFSVITGIPANVVFLPTALSAASKGLPPLLTLFSPALLAADSRILAVANPAASFIFNGILNVYFINNLTMPLWAEICEAVGRLTPAVLARHALMGLDNTALGRVKRYSLIGGKVIFCSTLSLVASLTMFFLDLKTDHPLWQSIGVLLSFTMLNYNGVLNTIVPVLSYPINTVYFRRSAYAKREHQITQDILRLKAAHITLLSAALMSVIDLLQKNDLAKLNPLFELSEKDLKDPINSKLLYCRLLKLAQIHSSDKIAQVFRFVLQALGAVLNLGSLPGYYFETAEGAAQFFANQFDSPLSSGAKYLIGLVIFSPMIGLSCDIAITTIGEMFDFGSYATSGVRKAYRQSERSVVNLVRNGCRGSWNMNRWSPYFRLPLAVQQNPALMLIPLYLLLPGGYFTTSTTLALNDDWLGPQGKIPALLNTAQYFVFLSIVFVWIFNFFPVREVLYASQEVGVKLAGNAQQKKELRLALFIRSLIQDWKSFSAEQTLGIFSDLLHEPQELNEGRSRIFSKELSYLFFKQTPEELFGREHRLVTKNKGQENERVVGDMREVIDELSVEWANHKNTQPPAYRGLRVFDDRRVHNEHLLESILGSDSRSTSYQNL